MTEGEWKERIEGIAYKPLGECTKEEVRMLGVERGRCAESLFYFVRYAKIIEPPTMTKVGGAIPFELWEHIKTILICLLTSSEVSILKSRQIGASWTVVMDTLWRVLFKRGYTALMYSKGELEAAELLGKVKRMYSVLPPFLQIKAEPDSTTEMGFPGMMSAIKALPSTETAGISFTASRLIYDEHIEHEYAEKNYSAALPTISAGGQVISIFTSNEDKLGSLAVSIFRGALVGANSYKALFFPYSVIKGRDDAWYEREKRKLTANELKSLTPELYMARNFPKSIEEALSPSKTVAVFVKEVLDYLKTFTMDSVGVVGLDSNIVHIYKPFHIGERYIAGSDTAHGVGKDYSCTVVVNVRSGEVVADIYSNRIEVQDFAFNSYKMLEHYDSPLWYIENNDWGASTINTVERLGYKNLGYENEKRLKVGWNTNKNREEVWGELVPAVNNKQVRIYNELGLRSFYDIIRVSEKNGRIEARSGAHDDYAMALAIAWFNRGAGEYGAVGQQADKEFDVWGESVRRFNGEDKKTMSVGVVLLILISTLSLTLLILVGYLIWAAIQDRRKS